MYSVSPFAVEKKFPNTNPPSPIQCCTGVNTGFCLAKSTLFGGRGYILVGKGDFKARYAKKMERLNTFDAHCPHVKTWYIRKIKNCMTDFNMKYANELNNDIYSDLREFSLISAKKRRVHEANFEINAGGV